VIGGILLEQALLSHTLRLEGLLPAPTAPYTFIDIGKQFLDLFLQPPDAFEVLNLRVASRCDELLGFCGNGKLLLRICELFQ